MTTNRVSEYLNRPRRRKCWTCMKRLPVNDGFGVCCQPCIDRYEAERPAREAAKKLADQWEKDRWPKMGDR